MTDAEARQQMQRDLEADAAPWPMSEEAKRIHAWPDREPRQEREGEAGIRQRGASAVYAELGMKPHIMWLPRGRVWACSLRGGGCFVGWGFTPRGAYEDWKFLNGGRV